MGGTALPVKRSVSFCPVVVLVFWGEVETAPYHSQISRSVEDRCLDCLTGHVIVFSATRMWVMLKGDCAIENRGHVLMTWDSQGEIVQWHGSWFSIILDLLDTLTVPPCNCSVFTGRRICAG